MDIKEVKSYIFKCPVHDYIEVGELYIEGNGVHCILCKSHLGYEHDIPFEVKHLVGRIKK